MPQSVHNGQLIATRHTSQGLGRVKTYRPRETGDAKLNLACYRNCELESTWLARSVVSDLVAADAHADSHPSRLDRRDEGLHAEDVHDPREIVGEHVQGHLGGNLRQALH